MMVVKWNVWDKRSIRTTKCVLYASVSLLLSMQLSFVAHMIEYKISVKGQIKKKGSRRRR
jgi:hypothetical protein